MIVSPFLSRCVRRDDISVQYIRSCAAAQVSFWNDALGRCTVHNGHAFCGKDHSVQGIRIAGAEDVFRIQPSLLRLGGDPAHEGRLAAARPSLQDVDGPGLLRGDQLIVQRIEAAGGVGPQEILDMWQSSHKRPSVSTLLRLRLCGGGDFGAGKDRQKYRFRDCILVWHLV